MVEISGLNVVLVTLAIVGAFLFSAGWIAGWPVVARSRSGTSLWFASGLVTARSSGWSIPGRSPETIYGVADRFQAVAADHIGIPWVLTAQLAAEMIFGGDENDSNWSAVIAIGWAVTALLSIGVGDLVYQNYGGYDFGVLYHCAWRDLRHRYGGHWQEWQDIGDRGRQRSSLTRFVLNLPPSVAGAVLWPA